MFGKDNLLTVRRSLDVLKNGCNFRSFACSTEQQHGHFEAFKMCSITYLEYCILARDNFVDSYSE